MSVSLTFALCGHIAANSCIQSSHCKKDGKGNCERVSSLKGRDVDSFEKGTQTYNWSCKEEIKTKFCVKLV